MKKLLFTGLAAIASLGFAAAVMAADVLTDHDAGLMLTPPDSILLDAIAAPPLDLIVFELNVAPDDPVSSDLFAALLPAEPERMSTAVLVSKNYDFVASDLIRRTGDVGRLRPG
jgi:hypothetical protein